MIAHKRLILPLLAIVALAGCAGPSQTAKAKEPEVDANGKKIEYVWYTPTGSSIPKRVRKDQLALTDAQSTQTQDVMTEVQRQGRGNLPAGD